MKKALLLALIPIIYGAAHTFSDDDALQPAVNTNFRPARAAGETPVEPVPAPVKPAPEPKAPVVKPAPVVVAPPPPPAPTPVAPAPAPAPVAPAVVAPAPVVQAPAPVPVVVDAKREEVERAGQEELVRRQEAQLAGKQLIKEGNDLYDDGKFPEAAPKFEAAYKVLPRAKITENDVAEATDGYVRSNYQVADAALRANEIAKARETAQKSLALAPNDRAALSILSRAERAEKIALAKRDAPAPLPRPDIAPEFLAKRDQIKKLFREGKLLMNSGQFDEAEKTFQEILLIDPYNSDAHVFLDEVNRQRLEMTTIGTDKSRILRLWEVSRSWLPPLRRDIQEKREIAGNEAIERDNRGRAEINKKMTTIILPEINFREAVITDVVGFLSEESRRLDPEKVGVNIVLQLGAAAAAPAPQAPPVAAEGEEAFAPAPAPVSSAPRISVTLRRIPLSDALRLITQSAGLKYRIEPFAVIIVPKDEPEGELVTRSYPVAAAVISTVVTQPVDGGGAATRAGGEEFVGIGAQGATTAVEDVRKFFEGAGVPFPSGATIVFNQRAGRIIIRNTPENLEIFEAVLRDINQTPPQVEIEAKFIEISQADLDEIGFQWKVGQRIFGNFDTGGGNTGQSFPPGGSGGEGGNNNLISGGLRDSTVIRGNAVDSLLGLGGASTVNNVATLRGVLTNPQFELIVRALAQKKSTDLLSAPKVTTLSGQSAQLRVVQEFIFPTEFTEPSSSAGGVTPSVPSGFKTREVGVLLNVTPTVGPDRYTINLTLIPEVSEFLGFIDYSPPPSTTIVNQGGSNITQTVQSKIVQPLFASRNITTSIVIYDGQTVVLGGLIREDINKIEDKIPFLGDIPFIGRLFRSKIDSRSKRNLLIFVSARLIDPAGNPENRTVAGAN